MIILIGTKGQLVKIAPVMKEIDKRNIFYKYVQTNQQPQINRDIEKHFGLKEPDLHLWTKSEDLTSPTQIPLWFFTCLCNAVKNREIFLKENIIVTHGDTLSTLLACSIGKLFNLKIAHIEAGLRSFSVMHPFPEELIRRVVSKFSDILFAPSDWAARNLRNERGIIINTKQNTVYDTLSYYVGKKKRLSYTVAAIHRQETIYNYKRFKKAIDVVEKASKIMNVIYIIHKTSKKQLKRFALYGKLEDNPQIKLVGYQDYLSFMELVNSSEFVITDGGGLQEETYFLNLPCLILRNKTERKEGLGETAYLSEFRDDKIEYFLRNYKSFYRKNKFVRMYPSKLIVDKLIADYNIVVS